MSNRITANSRVLLHFTLRLADGTIAESSRQTGKAALFCLGTDTLSRQLEQRLVGLARGDKRCFTLPPEQAFGPVNSDLVQYFSRRDFTRTGNAVPQPGSRMMFSRHGGGEMTGVIRDVACDAITVDFNHPLAGETVTYDIEVLEVDVADESAEVFNLMV